MILHGPRLSIRRDDPAVNRFVTGAVAENGIAVPWFDKLEGIGDYDRPYYGQVFLVGDTVPPGSHAIEGDHIICSLMSIGFRDTILGTRFATLQSHHAALRFNAETGRMGALGKWMLVRRNPELAQVVLGSKSGQIWMPDSAMQDDAADRQRTGLRAAWGEVLECGADCSVQLQAGTLLQYDESSGTVEFTRRGEKFIAVRDDNKIYSFTPEFLAELGAILSSREELGRALSSYQDEAPRS